MKSLLLASLIALCFATASAQTPPNGSNSQGSVSAPPGAYGVTPYAGPVPFNAYTGNMSRVVDDLSVPAIGEIGLDFKRYLHTRACDGTAYFDSGGLWRHSFQWDFSFVTVDGQQEIEVVYPDGTTNLFALESGSTTVYQSTLSVDDIIIKKSVGGVITYELIKSNNQVYNFISTTLAGSTVYYLENIFDSKGNETVLSWGHPVIAGSPVTSAWTLNSVAEPGGRTLTLSYYPFSTGMSGGVATTTLLISEVATSDGRNVVFYYGAYTPSSGGSTYITYEYLTHIVYSGDTVAADTANYQYILPTSLAAGVVAFPELSQVLDVRAEGIQALDFLYYDSLSTDAQLGTILAIFDDVSGSPNNLLEALNTTPPNPQTPVVEYQATGAGVYDSYKYTVDAQGTVTSVTDSDPTNSVSKTCHYAYTAGTGTVTTLATDANSHATTTVKSTGGQMLSRTYPIVSPETVAASETWTYVTSANYNYLTAYQDCNGNITTYTYGANPVSGMPKLLYEIIYPDSTFEKYTYNTSLITSLGIYQVATHLKRNGGTEYYTYDSSGHLSTVQDAAQTSAQVTTYSYDPTTGRLLSVEDANTNLKSYLYNDRGMVTQITYPGGSTKGFGYDNYGRIISVKNQLGYTTKYTYDSLNRILTAQDPLLHTFTYSYDQNAASNDAPIQVVSPTGKIKLYNYEMLWGYKAISATSEGVGGVDAETTNYTYDSMGHLATAKNPNLNTTTYRYDTRDRKIYIRDPLGNEDHLYYDDNSNLTSQNTPSGTTINTFDVMNRMLTSKDPKGQIATMTYDAEGQLLTYQEPSGSTYSYAYDLDERRTGMTYPDTSSESYAYDAVGNLHTYTTRDTRTQTFVYDNRNRNTSYSWNDGVTFSVSKIYDNANRVKELKNANCILTYTYDIADKLLTETENITGLGAQVVAYAYNIDDTPNTLTYPDGKVLTYGYDGRGNVTTITETGVSNPVATYGYDGNNNRTSKVLNNGATSTIGYDTCERLTSITDTFGTTTTQSFAYGYDSSDRATYVQRNGGLGDVFGYDHSDQLTSVSYGVTNPATTPTLPSRTVSYTLDASGNRTQVTDSVNGITNYTANTSNQYTAVGGAATTYDGRGNLTSANGWTYTYNAEGQLIKMTDGVSPETFYYDALGRCVATFTTLTTYYVYDLGWNTLEEFTTPTSTSPRTGTATESQRYVHGTEPDELLNKVALPSTTVYYQYDGAGNITQLINTGGAILEKYSYDIYGTPTITNASGVVRTASAYTNRYMFAGRDYLAGPNLYQYRNRVYSADLGRFLQPDPIGHTGDGYNIYRFCGNDPVNNGDPSGLDAYFGFDLGGGGDFFSYGSADYGGTVTYTNVSYSMGGGGSSGNRASGGGTTYAQAPQAAILAQTFHSGNASAAGGSYVDALQLTLTTTGIIPGPIGMVSNVAGALVSAYQGDWTGVGMSLAAEVPFAGWFADGAKLARLAKKAHGAGNELAHIGGEADCVAQTAMRLKNGLGATLDESPLFEAAASKSIYGRDAALNIIEDNSNMVVGDPLRLGSAGPGHYAIFEGNHIMHAEVSEAGVNVFDSAAGGSVTGDRLNYLMQAAAYPFSLAK